MIFVNCFCSSGMNILLSVMLSIVGLLGGLFV